MKKAAGLLYPERCALCDCLLGRQEYMLCGTCRKAVPFLKGPVCCKCGRPLCVETREYCGHCEKTPHLFRQVKAPFAYDGAVQNALLRLKYSHRAEYARFFARAVWAFAHSEIRMWDPDAIVPVPIHRERRIRRGYNQAELLAEELSALSGIPVRKDLIRRIRVTLPQKELGAEGRRNNLKGAFLAAETQNMPAKIMVVDDIYTTGSTMDTMTAHLIRGGAEEVSGVCAAVAPGS